MVGLVELVAFGWVEREGLLFCWGKGGLLGDVVATRGSRLREGYRRKFSFL